VRDAIIFARRGIPAIALVTEHFRAQAEFVAGAFGMPSIPRHVLPHPTSGRSDDFLTDLAARTAPLVLARLEAEVTEPPDDGVAR
jgi:hypothetical protein